MADTQPRKATITVQVTLDVHIDNYVEDWEDADMSIDSGSACATMVEEAIQTQLGYVVTSATVEQVSVVDGDAQFRHTIPVRYTE